MTSITWPSTLPQMLRLDGLSAKKKNNVVRTQMDVGPQKVRKRYTISSKEFTGTLLLTESQREILESWYDTTLESGSLRFIMKDPQTQENGEFRFLEDYDEESTDGLWTINLRLEKMNA